MAGVHTRAHACLPLLTRAIFPASLWLITYNLLLRCRPTTWQCRWRSRLPSTRYVFNDAGCVFRTFFLDGVSCVRSKNSIYQTGIFYGLRAFGRCFVGNVETGGLSCCLTDEMRGRLGSGGFFFVLNRFWGVVLIRDFISFLFFLRHFLRLTLAAHCRMART